MEVFLSVREFFQSSFPTVHREDSFELFAPHLIISLTHTPQLCLVEFHDFRRVAGAPIFAPRIRSMKIWSFPKVTRLTGEELKDALYISEKMKKSGAMMVLCVQRVDVCFPIPDICHFFYTSRF